MFTRPMAPPVIGSKDPRIEAAGTPAASGRIVMFTVSVVDPLFFIRRVRFRSRYVSDEVNDCATDWPDHTLNDGSPPPMTTFASKTCSPNPRADGTARRRAVPLVIRTSTLAAATRTDRPRFKVVPEPWAPEYIIPTKSLSGLIS